MKNSWHAWRGLRLEWSRLILPGLHIKRWILLLLVGMLVAGLGFAQLLPAFVHQVGGHAPLVTILTLAFLPEWLRGLLLLGLGFLISGVAVWSLNRSILRALLPGRHTPRDLEMLQTVIQRQRRRQGPRVVAIGGGTGMPQLLRGLREYTDHITAIVTVADDGGSSGRLRRQMGMLPPGDFRNNIAALSEAEDLMTRLFQYRFAGNEVGDGMGVGELAGHSFGNIFIATMAAVTGSFEAGIAESSRVLAVRGQILPSTLEHVCLCAEVCRVTEDGREEWLVVEGESQIPETGGRIIRVFLKPDPARAYPAAIQAILQADLIVAGPGSFFTSVLPNLLVPAIRNAIIAADAPRIYICNVATQRGETDGYTVSDHMRQLRFHAGEAFTTVLANSNYDPSTPAPFNGEWVRLPAPDEEYDYRLFTGDLIDSQRPWRHDARKLAARLMEVYGELQAERLARSTYGRPRPWRSRVGAAGVS